MTAATDDSALSRVVAFMPKGASNLLIAKAGVGLITVAVLALAPICSQYQSDPLSR